VEGDGSETVIRRISREELIVLGRRISGCKETGRLLRRDHCQNIRKKRQEKIKERPHRYRDPNALSPATSPVVKKSYLPGLAA